MNLERAMEVIRGHLDFLGPEPVEDFNEALDVMAAELMAGRLQVTDPDLHALLVARAGGQHE